MTLFPFPIPIPRCDPIPIPYIPYSPAIPPSKLPPLQYPDRFEVRYVSANGGTRWKRGWLNVSIVCVGECVGIEEIDDGIWNVYFWPLKLGRLIERHMKIEDEFGRLRRLMHEPNPCGASALHVCALIGAFATLRHRSVISFPHNEPENSTRTWKSVTHAPSFLLPISPTSQLFNINGTVYQSSLTLRSLAVSPMSLRQPEKTLSGLIVSSAL